MEAFSKKGAFKNFEKFTGKPLCQSLFSNKVASLRPAISLIKRLQNIPTTFEYSAAFAAECSKMSK